MSHTDGTTAILRKLLQRPEGVDNFFAAQVVGKPLKNVNVMFCQLVQRGDAFAGGPLGRRRYFADQRSALDYDESTRKHAEERRFSTGRPKRDSRPAGEPPPVRINARDPQLDPKQPAVVPAGVKRTVAKPAWERFAPDGPVPRVVNSDECRPWAKEAVR
jgi:hypothetical protein